MSDKHAIYYSLSSADSFTGVWILHDHVPNDTIYHGLTPEDTMTITNVEADVIWLMGFYDFTDGAREQMQQRGTRIRVFMPVEAILGDDFNEEEHDKQAVLESKLDEWRTAIAGDDIECEIYYSQAKTHCGVVWGHFQSEEDIPDMVNAFDIARRAETGQEMFAKYFTMGISREPFTLEHWDAINDDDDELLRVIRVGQERSQNMKERLAAREIISQRQNTL